MLKGAAAPVDSTPLALAVLAGELAACRVDDEAHFVELELAVALIRNFAVVIHAEKPATVDRDIERIIGGGDIAWVNCCDTCANFTPIPTCEPPEPVSELAYTSANWACACLKPTVPALATLLANHVQILDAAFKPLKPC